HADLGDNALQAATSAGALLTAEQAMTLSVTELRSAAAVLQDPKPETADA
ncbi:MAG: hypothetical protein QOJ00_437, partial [Actinomycetota bacterium]